ncbi:MAG: hypothetical protein ABWY66_09710 [Xanthobacteraceae bacterium]
MVQIENRIARCRADLPHVAAERAVHAVVRVEFELGSGAGAALFWPRGWALPNASKSGLARMREITCGPTMSSGSVSSTSNSGRG